jgi:hypothetical protein
MTSLQLADDLTHAEQNIKYCLKFLSRNCLYFRGDASDHVPLSSNVSSKKDTSCFLSLLI